MPTKTSLKKQAYDAILVQVLSGEFGPGSLLNRRGLAESLGMSAAPVHEAMLQLESDGFLEALPRVGTRVRAGTREEVRGHLILREALECQIARMICGERVASHLQQIMPLAAAVDAEEFADSVRAQSEVAFHVALADLANCPALAREYRRIMQIGLFYRINLMMSMPSRTPMMRHGDLLKTLATADPTRAAECIREHIWSGKPDILK